MNSTPSPSAVSYDERLGVPLRWWALATMFLASMLIAFIVSTPLWVALSGSGVLVALVVLLFVSYGSAHVSVTDGTFRAGRARIPVTLLGAPVALDAAAARRTAGVEADARAYLLLRPYVPRAVLVPIEDPADPAPYWLVSSRRPEGLVRALNAACGDTRPRSG